MSDVSVRAGASWLDVANGQQVPDHHITRVMTFLGSTSREDLVHTPWLGSFDTSAEESDEVVERLVFVGADGAGRRLRRKRFDVTAAELADDVDSIYLCEVADDEGRKLRYVFIDVRPLGEERPGASKVMLMCARTDFEQVYARLRMAGTGGALWRGSATDDTKPLLDLDPTQYVFAPELLERLRHEAIDFLQGDTAAKLRAWGVPAKRGIVLWGNPGNGKTILTRVCTKYALQAGMNVVIIEGRRRSTYSWERNTSGLGDELRQAAARAPALLIFEDIDLHCERRPESGAEPHRLADSDNPLAELLDFLDGVESTAGYVLLATTNYLKRLDPALRRAGRIDLEVEISPPTRSQRVALLSRAVKRGPQPPPNVEVPADLLDGVSFAGCAEVARRYLISAATGLESSPAASLEHAAEDFAKERTLIVNSELSAEND